MVFFNGSFLPFGEATAKAKASGRTWILFGGPTTRLK
jgi:hypothetical protein